MGGNQVNSTQPGLKGVFRSLSNIPGFGRQEARTTKIGYGGQELVEFLAVVPLLLLILFGAIDLGRLFHASITITNSARVGARYITMDPYPNAAGIFDIAKNLAVQEAQDSGVQISPDDVGNPVCQFQFGRCVPLQKVTMSVSYDFQFLLGPIFPDGFVVPGSACADGSSLCIRLTRTADMLVQ